MILIDVKLEDTDSKKIFLRFNDINGLRPYHETYSKSKESSKTYRLWPEDDNPTPTVCSLNSMPYGLTLCQWRLGIELIHYSEMRSVRSGVGTLTFANFISSVPTTNSHKWKNLLQKNDGPAQPTSCSGKLMCKESSQSMNWFTDGFASK